MSKTDNLKKKHDKVYHSIEETMKNRQTKIPKW